MAVVVFLCSVLFSCAIAMCFTHYHEPIDFGCHSFLGWALSTTWNTFSASFLSRGNSWWYIWLLWSCSEVNNIKLPYKWHRLTNMWISITKCVPKRKTHMTKDLERKSQFRHAKILYLGEKKTLIWRRFCPCKAWKYRYQGICICANSSWPVVHQAETLF